MRSRRTLFSGIGMPIALIDIDDTATRAAQIEDEPHTPPDDVVSELHLLHGLGVEIGIVTGRPIRTAKRMQAMLNLPCAVLGVEHGGFMRLSDGSEHLLVPPAEMAAFDAHSKQFSALYRKLGATVKECYQIVTGYWDTLEAFNYAKEVGDPQFNALLHTLGVSHLLRGSNWNPGDRSHNLMLKSAAKHQVTRFGRNKLGWRVVLGAGDSKGDLPLFGDRHTFGVVCHGDGLPTNSNLVQAVVEQKRGHGYIAQPHEPHGYGLAAGIREFRQRVHSGQIRLR